MTEFGKLNFATSFNPTSAFPLDARSYFESYDEAVAAASTAVEVGSADSVYYIGQTLTVVENGTSKNYVIQPDKTLKEQGSETSKTSDYNDLENKPKINNIELSGNKTLDELGVQPAGDYATKNEIPNVDSFITNTVDNLTNYYKKTETYTQEEINTRLGQITTINFKVVESLYDEFIWIAEDSKYEKIGSTTVDLSNYYNKSEADSKFALKVDIADMLTKTEAGKTYATKTELGNKLDASVYNSEKATFATKTEIGNINTILDNINGEVI